MLATMRHAFDCQKLSFRPRRGNADPSYQRRPRLGAGCQIGHPVMHDKHADKPAPKPPRSPRCVGCARPMQLIRRTPRFGELPDLYTFECRACGEWHIEEGEALVSRSADLGAALAV
jgi:hypothetical protein